MGEIKMTTTTLAPTTEAIVNAQSSFGFSCYVQLAETERILIEMGQIKIKNFEKNSHKLDYLYLLTPSGIEKKAKLAANFLKRKLVEYELLKHEIDSLMQDNVR